MSHESIEQALPSAIRKAASEPPPATGDGWAVCIVTGEGRHELRLAGQAQVARLALDLERLGFELQVEGGEDADFVFEQACLTSDT